MGSPRVLKEVLTRTGTPVRCSKAFNKIVIQRVLATVDGLDAGGAIHMAHSRDLVLPLFDAHRRQTA